MKRKQLRTSLLLLCILATVLATGCREFNLMKEITIADVDFSDLPDGDYEWYEDYKFVTARVVVTVQDYSIQDIRLIEHEHGPNRSAAAIIPRVLAAQSLIVDVVSGATSSSKVILKAIENALTQGSH